MNEHHYQRIDKGQERPKYPRIPPKSKLAKIPLKSLPEERRTEIALEVLSRYLHGEQVAQMAHEFETSDVTLYALLLRDHEIEWKDAQTARALARLERENTALEVASDPLSLARARELVRSAQWELERLLNRIYGQKQEVTHIVADLGDRLRRARERVIEHEAATPDGRITGVMSHSTPNEIKVLAAMPEVLPSTGPRDPIDPKDGG